MPDSLSLLYQVAFARDAETDRIVAEVPALQLADLGVDVPEALDRLQAMVSFHLDCLVQEGKPIPVERREDAGFYLRVRPPPHAAQAPQSGRSSAGSNGLASLSKKRKGRTVRSTRRPS